MAKTSGFHKRQEAICSKIRSLLKTLAREQSKYDQIAPKIEYWIEYVLREGFATVDELVEGVSDVAWEVTEGSCESIGRFLREFYDAPHRSEQARSVVSRLCPHALQLFAIASAEDLYSWTVGLVSSGGAPGLVSAASFVGHLVEWGLLSHELVRRHLTKPLTNHYDGGCRHVEYPEATRARAIYKLFIAAGNTLLQGLLEPDDVRACFDILDSWPQEKMGFDAAKLRVRRTTHAGALGWSLTCEQELREIHASWIRRKAEQMDPREAEGDQGGEEDMLVAGVSIEVKASTFVNIHSNNIFPALTTSTVSTVPDPTPTELGEKIERDETLTAARHNTLYFEDGNVEIVCGDTIFRVHSSIISFSSSELQKILSQTALVGAPTSEGRPRITILDSAEDFALLLKMIYTPGFVSSYLCLNYAG